MKTSTRVLFFFVLPFLATLSYPPASLLGSLIAIPVVALVFAGLGWLLWRGYSLALTLSIFLQGLNVIVRLMMLFPHLLNGGMFDWGYTIANLLGLGVSLYLVLRLDQVDVRIQMVA